ncbi:protein FATTY ACID EXPORT 3, chloroplastic isoform X2 [Quercus suber]|uniref:protein FATTY ACID EXPORT 3, chloroplastic isoform X2 n=1 Tax=Quercus suber TaxID=58331 RepID=UPI000CE20E40|nr:protein FATTY ACID EXPORT 3, chloroplastic isoform X4 [Quercus suber]
MESISFLNPNPSYRSTKSSLVQSSRFDSLLRPRTRTYNYNYKLSLLPKPVSVSSNGVSSRFLSRNPPRRFIVASSASHEDSSQEIEVEKGKDDHNLGAEDSQEVWKELLESFKEQALKMQSVSQEAYELYSKKAVIILKETSEQLKIQTDKARDDLLDIAKEISEEGKVYISTAAENSPEPVKDIVETFNMPTEDLKEISRVHDFRVGIPYGLLLSVGGFLSFMLTGNIAAIRFGVILGGTLLALSVSSLKSYKKGESFPLALKGQAAIASIIFLRELSQLSQAPSFLSFVSTVFSGAVVVFFIYKIILDRKRHRGSNLENQTEN